jgi:hypothetical protein
MCAEQAAYVRRRSWAGYTINMFEFEFPTGTRAFSDAVRLLFSEILTDVFRFLLPECQQPRCLSRTCRPRLLCCRNLYGR